MTKVSTAGVSTGFDPLPAGPYRAALVKYSERTSKAGHPAFSTEWAIVSGPDGDTYAGRKTFISGSLQPHALFTIKRIGFALGVDDDVLEAEEGWDPAEILPDYYGDEVTLKITASEYNGKPSNNVDVLINDETMPDGGSW